MCEQIFILPVEIGLIKIMCLIYENNKKLKKDISEELI